MHPCGVCHRPAKDPLRQWCVAQRPACLNVFANHPGHVKPACLLPQLKRALPHAKAPAHRQVDVSRRGSNILQMHSRIVEAVAQNRPQKPSLRILGLMQQPQAFCCGFLENADICIVGLLSRLNISVTGRIVSFNTIVGLPEKTGARLLSQMSFLNQPGQYHRHPKTAMKRISLGGQGFLQGPDDMRHGVKSHHVGSPIGAGTGPPQLLACQVVDQVIPQTELFSLDHSGQHAGNAHPIGDEIGRVLGAHHALAQHAGAEGLEVVENICLCHWCGNEFHQIHVARWIEEVNATETRTNLLRQRLAERGNTQPRSVGGQNGVWRHMWRDLVVQGGFPVHAFGNGFNHHITFPEQIQVFFVVGCLDQVCVIHYTQRRRPDRFQAFDSLERDSVLVPFFGGQVKQHHWHPDINQMSGNLRTHHTSAKHGDFANLKT